MSKSIVINGVKRSKVLNYIDEIKSKGLISGHDFIWWFLPEDSKLRIEFNNEKYATFYQLKWSSKWV